MLKNAVKNSIVGVALAAAMVVGADYALSIPTVYESYASRECVRVENYPGLIFGKTAFSCENMPRTFDHVWVE